MSKVQAQLTKDPNDKNHFHRKQQLTLCSAGEIHGAKSLREPPEERSTYSGPVFNISNIESLPWARIDVETCLDIMGSDAFLWGQHEANIANQAFNKNTNRQKDRRDSTERNPEKA